MNRQIRLLLKNTERDFLFIFSCWCEISREVENYITRRLYLLAFCISIALSPPRRFLYISNLNPIDSSKIIPKVLWRRWCWWKKRLDTQLLCKQIHCFSRQGRWRLKTKKKKQQRVWERIKRADMRRLQVFLSLLLPIKTLLQSKRITY